jgi:hypothetical protein
MKSLNSELKRVGLIADIEKFEEAYIEDDTELTPIQRKLILRRLMKKDEKPKKEEKK